MHNVRYCVTRQHLLVIVINNTYTTAFNSVKYGFWIWMKPQTPVTWLAISVIVHLTKASLHVQVHVHVKMTKNKHDIASPTLNVSDKQRHVHTYINSTNALHTCSNVYTTDRHVLTLPTFRNVMYMYKCILLLFQIHPNKKHISLIVSPLNILMQHQVQTWTERGSNVQRYILKLETCMQQAWTTAT